MTAEAMRVRDPEFGERVMAALLARRGGFVRFARRRVPAESDADDVVQTAFLRATVGVAALREESQARAWFYRILRTTIADERARSTQRARIEHAATDEQVSGDVHAPAATDHTPCPCVAEIVAAVPGVSATLLRGVVLDERSVKDVAAELNITANDGAVRLHRARTALRKAIARRCGVHTLRACLDCTCAIDGTCERSAATSPTIR